MAYRSDPEEDLEDEEVGSEPGDEDEDWDEDEDGNENVPPKRSRKKKFLLVAGLFVLVACGGTASAYFTGLLDPILRSVAGDGGQELNFSFASAKPGYFKMPEILVNLNMGRGESSILKVRISLDLDDVSGIPHLKRLMPRIVDDMQTYLRELRVEDLQGTRNLRRLQNEMLARVNRFSGPAKINRVLFKELLVQ